MRKIRLLATADPGWRQRLLTAVFAIAAATSVAAASSQPATSPAAFTHSPARDAAAPAPTAGTTPLTAVRPGSAQAQAMQHRVQADLAARQAAAIAPRPARAEAAAIPVLRADAARAAASAAIPKQPEMAAAASAGTQPMPAAAHPARLAAAATATPSAPGTADTGLDSLWNNYGNSADCRTWSGGDATNSVDIGGGFRAWFFSDTFLGSPAARKTLFDASTLHNSIVVQQGSTLTTETGGNTCEETNTNLSFWNRYAITPAAAPDTGSGGFYWTGDQMVAGSNVIKFYYHGNRSVVPFAIDSSAVATIPISTLLNNISPTITPTQFTSLCPGTGSPIIWGYALLNWGGYVYIYGWSTANSSLLYLAKTTTANLTSPGTWQTFAGLDSSGNPVWTTCGANATPLPITRGSGMSVAAVTGSSSLWLVQQDPGSGLVGGPIAAHPAANPWSFGNKKVVLYYPPQETHAYPDYYLTYEARLQPGLASSNTYVVISYNVNSTAVDTGCVIADVHDASIYRPRFVDVPTSAFNASAATDTAASSGTSLPVPSYGIQDYGPTDQAPPPAVNAAGTILDSAAGTGPNIDGVTDWYDQWGSLAGGCPGYHPPSTLTAAPSTPNGMVTLTWPTVGTDVWFWGYQADQTAGTAFAKTWGGLWAEPSSPTATTVSVTVAPVTSSATNGDTYAWYVQPFGAQSNFIGPVGVSPTVAEAVTIQRPRPPSNLTGSNGTGAKSEFALGWNDVTYPSGAVYYWIALWDISKGQTEQQALTGQNGAGYLALPLGPGTTSYDIQGWTPDNNVILSVGDQYGFFVQAENLAGYSDPSIPVSVLPSPVCDAGTIGAGVGDFAFQGGPNVYLYFGGVGGVGLYQATIGVTDPATGVEHISAIAPPPAVEVLWFQEGADPPISWILNYELQYQYDVWYNITSSSC